MLSVLISWIYILIISYIIGFSILELVGKNKDYKIKSNVVIILTGLLITMVYAEYFSLFYKVGLLANSILVTISIILLMINRNRIRESLKSCFRESNVLKIIVGILLVILFAYGTSHGYMHYDTDLYHAQSIRWIEEFGVVKGLGNLQSRLAYNSSAFCLSALFSFSFLGGQSFHTVSGFLALLTAFATRDLFSKDTFLKPRLHNFIQIAAVYYILNIFDEMVSPASDYFVILLILIIAIYFVKLCEDGELNPYPYALLSLCTLMVFSVKISGSLVILLVIYPAYLLIKQKKVKDIIQYLIIGIVSVLPFFLRNIILSGYLIYPMAGIDIFNFEYKIPKVMAEYDANEIEVFGRGHSDLNRISEPFSDWIFDWFRSLGAVNKLCFLATLAGVIISIGIVIYVLIKKKLGDMPLTLFLIVMDICFMTWLKTSPNIRFGCVFIYIIPLAVFGYLYTRMINQRDRGIIYGTLVALFFAYKLITFGGEMIRMPSGDYLVLQQDYGHYEACEYELHGIKFYYPKDGDRMGYEYFPSAPMMAEDIFIGDSIKDGFKDIIHQK